MVGWHHEWRPFLPTPTSVKRWSFCSSSMVELSWQWRSVRLLYLPYWFLWRHWQSSTGAWNRAKQGNCRRLSYKEPRPMIVSKMMVYSNCATKLRQFYDQSMLPLEWISPKTFPVPFRPCGLVRRKSNTRFPKSLFLFTFSKPLGQVSAHFSMNTPWHVERVFLW